MESSPLFRFCALLFLLVLVPGLAFAITADPELPPCPCNLKGRVMSWSCVSEASEPYYPYPLPDVEVQVRNCMGGMAMAVTDEQGRFEFSCIEIPTTGCNACVRITNIDIPGYVTAFDASLVLRYLVHLETLDRCPQDPGGGLIYPQLVAADVNCMNGINAYDASLILKFTVDLIDHFGCGDDWVYFPAPVCVDACVDDMTLYCICIGDVSGPSSGPTLLAAADPAEVSLGLPSHYSNYVDVPVEITGAENMSSAQFHIAFDESEFSVVDARPAGLTDGFFGDYNSLGGLLRVAMAGAMPVAGDGQIAIVTFEKKSPLVGGALTRLLLSDVLINEDTPIINHHGPGTPEIFKLSLGPVSPNPTVGKTAIVFSVSATSHVTLGIYNVSGELVETVFAGEAQAGRHQVTWDGTDASGSEVARGVYFCRVESGGESATDKIVFMK